MRDGYKTESCAAMASYAPQPYCTGASPFSPAHPGPPAQVQQKSEQTGRETGHKQDKELQQLNMVSNSNRIEAKQTSSSIMTG